MRARSSGVTAEDYGAAGPAISRLFNDLTGRSRSVKRGEGGVQAASLRVKVAVTQPASPLGPTVMR